MDSWPADFRGKDFELPDDASEAEGSLTRRQRPTTTKFHPEIATGGLSAGTLYHASSGRLRWTTLASQSTEHSLVSSPTLNLYPPTRRPFQSCLDITVKQRAEEGANFLRKHFPEVFDVPAELIRAEIETDITIDRQRQEYDPMLGQLLSVLSPDTQDAQARIAVAFAAGQTYSDLTLLTMDPSSDDNTCFSTSYNARLTLNTPIMQISPFTSDPRSNPHLIARTMGMVNVIDVNPIARRDEGSSSALIELDRVTHAAVGDRPIVDIATFPDSGRVLLVNNKGGVYQWAIDVHESQLPCVYPSSEEGPSGRDPVMWKVCYDDRIDGCVLASDHFARKLDFRTAGTTPQLYSTTTADEMITSIEHIHGERLLRMSTTKSVLFLDDRFPGQPVLAYHHNRVFDRTLRTTTVPWFGSPVTLLSSRKNGLVTLYDIGDSEGLVTSRHEARSLPPISNSSLPHDGLLFFPHARQTAREALHAIQLSDNGSLLHRQYTLQRPTASLSYIKAIALSDHTGLAQPERDAGYGTDHLTSSNASELDLTAPYQAAFCSIEEDNPPEVTYDTIERMPYYWQNMESPVEHFLTQSDIAMRLKDESQLEARADFLNSNALDTRRGFRALAQGKLKADVSYIETKLHHSIRESVWSLCKTRLPTDPGGFFTYLHVYDRPLVNDQTLRSLEHERLAKQQIVLDISLAIDIYTNQLVKPPTDSDPQLDELDRMSVAAGNMNLHSEPAAVEFCFLHPTSLSEPDDSNPSMVASPKLPMGVRLLLGEWEIGSRIGDYLYEDPYAVQSESPTNPPRTAAIKHHTKQVTTGHTVSSGPVPPVITSTQPARLLGSFPRPIVATSSRGAVGSQPTVTITPIIPASQIQVANTQILRGQHGGRTSSAKTKPTKKRLGGF